MRLDAEIRDFIVATYRDRTAQREVIELLARLDESVRFSMVLTPEIADGARESIEISEWILVVTRDAIGYGWPMREVLWLSASASRSKIEATD